MIVQTGDEIHLLDNERRGGIEQRYSEWSEKGFRVLGVATRKLKGQADSYSMGDEKEMTFLGFLLFFDPPKADVQQAIVDLAKRGVQLKIITGDNEKVARHVAQTVPCFARGVPHWLVH